MEDINIPAKIKRFDFLIARLVKHWNIHECWTNKLQTTGFFGWGGEEIIIHSDEILSFSNSSFCRASKYDNSIQQKWLSTCPISCSTENMNSAPKIKYFDLLTPQLEEHWNIIQNYGSRSETFQKMQLVHGNIIFWRSHMYLNKVLQSDERVWE